MLLLAFAMQPGRLRLSSKGWVFDVFGCIWAAAHIKD